MTSGFIKAATSKAAMLIESAHIAAKSLAGHGMGHASIDPWRLYWLPAESIDFIQAGAVADPQFTFKRRGAFNKRRPMVCGGDWDLCVTPLAESLVFKGFHQRFALGMSWEETDLFPTKVAKGHPNDGARWQNADVHRFRALSEFYDAVYDSMCKNGWKARYPWKGHFWDELTINIGRNGTLIRNSSGHHRLCIAKLLALPAIPTRVLVVHGEWRGDLPRARVQVRQKALP